MKICDLTQFYSPVSGGVRRYIEQKSAYLRAACPEDQHVLIIPGEKDTKVINGPCSIYTIASPLISRTSRYRALFRLSAVEDILEREKPDIIESGDPYQVAWKAIFSGRALGIPAVGFYHSHFPEAYIRSVAKYFGKVALQISSEISIRYVLSVYNRFERTLVPSPALAGLLTEWGVENAVNIDLGVDLSTFHPASLDSPQRLAERQSLQLPPNRRLLLYVGRLAAEKNVRTLFDAFRLLHQNSPGTYHLVCLGDGTQRSLLQKLQTETGEVTWNPYCSDSLLLARYYRSADLFVHPGLQETFGLVTLESQACGTPVVGIRGSYMDRIIFSGQDHWADQNNPGSLAHAIETMFANQPAQAGLRAAHHVQQHYSWHHVFQRLFAIYRQVIEEYNP